MIQPEEVPWRVTWIDLNDEPQERIFTTCAESYEFFKEMLASRLNREVYRSPITDLSGQIGSDTAML